MGNAIFADYLDNGWNLYFHPEIQPDPNKEPTFDPNLGFANGRKERVSLATKEELQSAKVPLKARDYCAHKLLTYYGCRADNFPWVVRCEHEKHDYLHCQYEDFILRAKEYERERRLRIRAQKQQKEVEAAA